MVRAEILYHRDGALLYIAFVMFIWAAPIPADRETHLKVLFGLLSKCFERILNLQEKHQYFPNFLYRKKNTYLYGKCQRFEKKRGSILYPKSQRFHRNRGVF